MRLICLAALVALPVITWAIGARARRSAERVASHGPTSAGAIAATLRGAAARESQQRRRSARLSIEPPSWVVVVSAAALVVAVAMALTGAVWTGVNVDEHAHVLRLQTWFDTGWYLPWFYMDGDRPAATVTDVYVYAPVAMVVAHLATVLVGVETWGEPESTAQAYAVRHVVIAMFGLVGVAAVGVIGRLVLATWRWGLVTAAVLGAIPLWTGHAMFNVKDTPTAAGVAVATLGLVALSRPRIGTSRGLRWSATVTLGTGVFLAVGVRPGSWPMIVLGIAVMMSSTWVMARRRIDPATARVTAAMRLGLVGLACGGALLALVALYPRAFANVPRLVRSSLGESADFVAWEGWVLTNGVGHGVPSPWWYVPVWVAHQIPVLILLFAVVGVVAVLTERLVGRNPTGAGEGPLLGVGIVAAVTLLAPAASVLLDVRLQSGLRQLLFVIPGVAVLATVGLWYTVGVRRGRRAMQPVVALAGCVALIVPTIDQLRMFPYNYAYFNELATFQQIDGRWATDSLRTSFREIVRQVGPDGEVICSAHPSGSAAVGNGPIDIERRRSFWSCDAFPSFGLYADRRGSSPTGELRPGQFWLVRENQFGDNVPSNCSKVASVTRPLRTRTVTMSYVAICDRTGGDDAS